MSEPTLHDVFVALGGDEAVTDPTIAQLVDAAGGAVKKIARAAVGDPADAAHGVIEVGLTFPAGVITEAEVQAEQGGSGWQEGDGFTIGGGEATGEVDEVDGGGALVAFHITAGGTGYEVDEGILASPILPSVGSGALLDITAVESQPPATASLALTLGTGGDELGPIPVDQDTTAGDLAEAISDLIGFPCDAQDPEVTFGSGDYLVVTVEAGHGALPIEVTIDDFDSSSEAEPVNDSAAGVEAEADDHPVLTLAICGDTDDPEATVEIWVKVTAGTPGAWGKVEVIPPGGPS